MHQLYDPPPVSEIDNIIGVQFRVLDQGFVRVIDYMGDDAAIMQAARVSYGRITKGEIKDARLIRYLMRNRHTSPFEMCEIKLHVKVPMDCWRQWVRHRTASINEHSTRYAIANEAAARTAPDAWRRQSPLRKQGSVGLLDSETGMQLTLEEEQLLIHCREVYAKRISAGVAREQARKDLPLSTYTEAFWKTDLHNLLHFLELRMHPSAQLEIRSYARTIGYEIVRRWCPVTWKAFLDYRIDSITLSRPEISIIAALTKGRKLEAIRLASDFGWLTEANSERLEAERKLECLGLEIPWGASCE